MNLEERKGRIDIIKDADGKMYLYDMLNIKKETSKPPRQ